jgi:HK97 gp10 family phage protein
VSFLRLDLQALEALMDDMGDTADAAARPASQAAAQVLYDEVKRNIAHIPQKTGNLARAIYQVFSRDNSAEGKATYQISWNTKKAPHGHLVEFGHIQRYVTYMGRNGQFYTAVRPGMKGKVKKPGRKAPQSVKDAYYVPLATPKQIAAKPFVRPATSKYPEAQAAAQKVILDALT